MKIFQKIIFILFSVLCIILLSFVVKGNSIDQRKLEFQNDYNGRLLGPFESSGSNSRYALVVSFVESQSAGLSEFLARFAAPDIVTNNGKYYSVFAPGVSFAAAPFYVLGKLFGIPQLSTYLFTTIIAFINMCLVTSIAKKLGAGFIPSLLSGFIFLFGTNALVYAFTLTQHHLSVFLILLSVLLIFRKPSLLRNTALGFSFGIGLLVDIPNAFMMLPIILYALLQHISVYDQVKTLQIKVKMVFIFLAIGLLPTLLIFGMYNKETTGSYVRLTQFIGRADIAVTNKPETRKVEASVDPYAAKLPFVSRLQLNGLYILLLSNERGWVYYSPIVFIGVLGLFLALSKKEIQKPVVVLLSIVGVNISMYSMFGDPWGGWAFGPRYLIPGTAIFCTGIGYVLEKYKRNILFGIVFILIAAYGIRISLLGAFTTTQIPPKQEADHLITFIPYTPEYNRQLIKQNKSSSLIYNLWMRDKIPLSFVIDIYEGVIFVILLSFSVPFFLKKRMSR